MTELIVTTKEGQLQGTYGQNLDGDDFLKFFGIPYGKPPVGELRFKPPQPIDPWIGVKDATKVGSASLSRDDLTTKIVGSEDCLYLNVYTKNSPYPAHKRYFSPVIETPNVAAFISKSPLEIFKEGTYNKVPIIMGYNKTEGMVLDGLPDYNVKNFIPYELNVNEDSNDCKVICQILGELYSGNSNDDHYNLVTDSYFLVGIIQTLRTQLRLSNCPIYIYRMSLEGQLNFLKRIFNKLDEPGVCHADDLGYLFYSDITPEIKPGSLEEKSVRNFVELWTNFAKYGNPTPDDKLNVSWKPVENEENIRLLDIGETLTFKQIPERNRAMVWLNILKKWPFVKFN